MGLCTEMEAGGIIQPLMQCGYFEVVHTISPATTRSTFRTFLKAWLANFSYWSDQESSSHKASNPPQVVGDRTDSAVNYHLLLHQPPEMVRMEQRVKRRPRCSRKAPHKVEIPTTNGKLTY